MISIIVVYNIQRKKIERVLIVCYRMIFAMMDKKGRIDVYKFMINIKKKNLWIRSIPKYLDQL